MPTVSQLCYQTYIKDIFVCLFEVAGGVGQSMAKEDSRSGVLSRVEGNGGADVTEEGH